MSIPGMRRAAYGLTALAVTALGSVAVAPDQADARPKPVDVKLLAINDFHGNLEPPSGSSGSINGVPAGGVEYLATELKKLRGESKKEQKHTITVAAGDLIGASPLLSAAFHDEPTIEALNLAGLDVASVGNHEFDEGANELLRIQNGGCHPVDAAPTAPRTWARTSSTSPRTRSRPRPASRCCRRTRSRRSTGSRSASSG